ILLLILTAILQKLPPFSYTIGSVGHDMPEIVVHPPLPPTPPAPPHGPRDPAVRIEKKNSEGRDVIISIDREGVRITPRSLPASAPAAASAASGATSAAALPPSILDSSVEIKLPPGADSDEVRQAVEEARAAVVEAIRESQEKTEEAAKEAADAAHEAAMERAGEDVARSFRRIRERKFGDFLSQLAWLVIIASAILKI